VQDWSGGRHCDVFLAEECVDGHGRSGERTASTGIEKKSPSRGGDCLPKPAVFVSFQYWYIDKYSLSIYNIKSCDC
jgi:hypothetical protein